ncbi:bifunctional hydroxymethylpyrimidine kinase/phosphomethylpyrimidine kinase [Luethyella okanaganae]|uniref:Bifunctional hydroxymethylpyrimidine kinase/phosphomethylpyrimidine kinase n=1 Tax=Luethyella okanaganae TaxID=69372 RepID=A0ABW1VJV8_9MICO
MSRAPDVDGPRIPRVLSIAGTDPSGGAGIQADLKSIAANGGYGMAVVSALVAQNTRGVRSVHTPPVGFLREQLEAVSDDIAIDAVKIGMLGSVSVVEAVRSWLVSNPVDRVVLDPVMIATSGDRLLDADAEDAVRALLPLVDLVTPNLAELAVLSGEAVAEIWEDALAQALRVSAAGRVTVLVKGGHLSGSSSPDALVDATGSLRDGRTVVEVAGERVDTRNTHGTGCSLSSAMATLGVRFGAWEPALLHAKQWLTESLLHSDELHVGSGNGPINHFATLWATATAHDTRTVTDSWWKDIAAVRCRIDELPLVRGLADGTLDGAVFGDYLAQDALYLRDYSRVLAAASQRAPSAEEQVFWADCASGAITAEMELHRTWLAEHRRADDVPRAETPPSRATSAYVNHLLALVARGDYGVLVAGLLPCFWIYHDLGARLLKHSHTGHPYAAWLDTYSDPAFAEVNRRAIEIVGAVGARASHDLRERMRRAFVLSAEHEEAFFADPFDRLSRA